MKNSSSTNVKLDRTVAGLWLCLCLLCLLALPGVVQAQFTYTTNDGTITITGYTGPGGAVTIPDTINGLLVTSIADNAFYANAGMTSVVIPDSVSSLGIWAFAYCQDLASISLPNGLASIAEYAFFNCAVTNVVIPGAVGSVGAEAFAVCYNLTDLTIGAGVTNIGTGAFSGCALTNVLIPSTVAVIGDAAFTSGALQGISVDPASPFYKSIDGVLFDHSGASLIQYPTAKGLGAYVIPDGVMRLGSSAFWSAYSLTNITFPNGLRSIRSGAFEYCLNLQAINLPDSITNLGPGAFAHCYGLTDFVIPAGITSIPAGLLFSCWNLTNVVIPTIVTNVGDSAFDRCAELRELSLPPGLLRTGFRAFAGTGLRNLQLPDSLVELGPSAFYECYSLTNITIGDKVTSPLWGVFQACGNLRTVTVGGGVSSILDYTFSQCSSLVAVFFRGDAPSLDGSHVFESASPTIYYLPGTSGWSATFGGRPTAPWSLPTPLILAKSPSFGVQNNLFGFIVSWATNIPVVVEASANLAAPNWATVSTNTLSSGWFYFSDPEWTNYASRIYRVRSQ